MDDLIDRTIDIEQLAKETKIVAANGVATITEVAQVSALLELGIWVTTAEAEGMYGKDWRTSSQAKAQHKARILGFFGCKSFNDMNEHFGMCVAVAASQGHPAVAVRINQMWTEGTASLGTDFKALMAYYTCFFTRTHLGQGIPVTIDPNLVVRFKGGDSCEMAKKLEEAESNFAVMNQVVKDMKRDNAELKKSVERIERTRSRTAEKQRERGGKEKVKCFRCNGNHLVKDCPEEDTRDKADAGSKSDSD